MSTIWTPRLVYLTSIICGYGFLVQFAPIMPYYVPYLVQVKHLGIQQVTTQVLPVVSYSVLLFTILSAPACRLLSYRGVVIIGTFSVLASQVILLLARTLFWIQLSMVIATLAIVQNMVFSSYLFLLTNKEEYQHLTSFSKASSSMSLFISAELGQLLVSKGAKFVNLFYITLIMVSLACTLSFFLPQDPSSLQILEPLNQSSFPLSRSLRQLMFDLYQSYKESWRVIKQAWKSKGLQVLSFWWAFNMAAMPMVAAYGTSLFEAIHSVSTYNGHVMAATQTVACLSSFTAVPLSRITDQTGGLGYFLGSVLVGSLCMVMAYANSIWIAYAAYVLIIGVTDLLFCLLVVQCAKSISNGQYILVFSFNALGGMIMQAVFQAIIEIIGISVFTLYFILGIHFFIVGLLFALICIAFYCKTRSIVLVPIESSLPTYGTFSVLETS